MHTEWHFPPSYNVAPTQQVPIVRMVDGERRGDRLRWGLIPFFARGIPPKYSTTNARIDTVQTCSELSGTVEAGPTVPCSGVRILRVAGQADGKSKIPFYIHTNDQEIAAFAGLWESSRTDTGEVVESVTHITVPANSLVGEIHNTKHRMPAIMEKAHREAWLTATPEEAWETLRPYPDDMMVAWPISTRVNTPRNNDAKLIESVSAQEKSPARLE